MNPHIDSVLTHHLTAFGDNSLDEILKDYQEKSEIYTPSGTRKGLTAIREFFKEFFDAIPAGSSFQMLEKQVKGNLAYIVWSSESDKFQIPVGTDTFLFEDDKIVQHTVADYRIKK
ncbi:MAG: nuclear transport factor 2 family protein [Pedobacter sp.]|nr:MAG: nuclear transport factor 2 family protein [Pedobacter sp.]